MKCVILAGGKGTRISEETIQRPKPMIEIGGRPILWHIMKIYASHSVTDFIVCCGYKGNIIKEYFTNYLLYMSDVTFDMTTNEMHVHRRHTEPWRVTLVDTGEDTMTGGRLKRVTQYLENEDSFCFTYGDGVGDINVTKLIDHHRGHGKLATVTAVQPPGRYGAIELDGSNVAGFTEKPQGDGAWINGGFFVLSPRCLDLIAGDDTPWEAAPLTQITTKGQLEAFRHSGFWHPLDTLRDKNYLEALWQGGAAPWKIWS
jgi:glucose-1-phosphate cytidylyltransferase